MHHFDLKDGVLHAEGVSLEALADAEPERVVLALEAAAAGLIVYERASGPASAPQLTGTRPQGRNP